MKPSNHKALAIAVSSAILVSAAWAATQLSFSTPIALSANGGAHKVKISRMGDGTLVTVFGDYVAGSLPVYDIKGQNERGARDLFVRICKPDAIKTCNAGSDWSAPVNISNSAALSSITSDWKGDLGDPGVYGGDAEKPNIASAGPVSVVSWVSSYCPGGQQRARKYVELDSRIVPFTCAWESHSIDNGKNWSVAKQLSSGERSAKQDSGKGSFDSVTKNAKWVITWQEDPTGLELGDADGPGDGASGANVTGGTDVWSASAAFNTTTMVEGAIPWVESARITDNVTSSGTEGELDIVFDAEGNAVQQQLIERGPAGASRPNVGMVGSKVMVAYEETKGSEGIDEGKFIRYHLLGFSGSALTQASKAGCIISDPQKNARRVRFVTQSQTDAGEGGGMPLAIFWKEGSSDQGGPSDIMLRRGLITEPATVADRGLKFSDMVPAVDASCETSDYASALALANTSAQNLSSRTKEAATGSDNLADGTELNWAENALAHRGLLRGQDLWVGYSYTADLGLLQYANEDNYNFWIRHYNNASGWDVPKNISNITDTSINVREPRIVGTPKSGTACADPANPVDPTACQNPDVFYVAWGTQTNVSEWDPVGPEDLGLSITRTTDAGGTFEPIVQLSDVQGGLVDEESAFESQINLRPDGDEAYAVWNQASDTVEVAMYSSGTFVNVDDGTDDDGTGDDDAATTDGGGGGGGFGLPVLGILMLAAARLLRRRN